jgi:hypothetical protein
LGKAAWLPDVSRSNRGSGNRLLLDAGALYFRRQSARSSTVNTILLISSTGVSMSRATRTAQLEDIIDELIALYLAQAANLREYGQAAMAGEGTVNLERTLRHREVQRAELYRQFEQAAFPDPAVPNLPDQT